MSDTVNNPLAPPAPDFTPPSGNLEISRNAREFAQAPIGLDARAPTDAEQVQRLAQAREVLGERFWQERAPTPPTAAEQAAADQAHMLGVNAGASSSDYAIQVPQSVAPEASQLIREAMAGLQFSKPYGDMIGQRIVDTGRALHGKGETERTELAQKERRQIDEWSARKDWNLPKVAADVQKLLNDSKVDARIASIMLGNAEIFIRLATHIEHLKAVKKG